MKRVLNDALTENLGEFDGTGYPEKETKKAERRRIKEEAEKRKNSALS